MKFFLLAGMVALFASGPAFCGTLAPDLTGLDNAAANMLAKRCVVELQGANARKSIRGAKALWTQLNLQKPGQGLGMDSLEADLKLTDMEGQLRSAGFKLMDPKKRSLALGLRPTLILSVYYSPKGTEGNDTDFYLVVASAMQDVTPLGGDKMTMTTWLKAGNVIPATGHIAKDVDAIRASARACVMAFINVAQDNEQAPEASTPAP